MKRKMFLTSILLLMSTYFTINVWGNTTEIQLKLDKTEYVGLGDHITIQTVAPQLNLRSFYAEQIEVKVSTSEDLEGFIVSARETKANSGVFEAQLSFSLVESSSKDGIIKVKTDTRIFVRYRDIIKEAVWKPGDAVLSLNNTAYSGYGDQPLITLQDNDLNLNPTVKEQISVTVKSLSDASGISVKLVEKSSDSGIFAGTLSFDPSKSDDMKDRLKIDYNDTLTVCFEDTLNTSGMPEIRIFNATWKPSKGNIRFSSSAYTGLKSTAAFTVSDQDLNLRPTSIDSARVRIISDSDPLGMMVIAYETGINTGVFSGSVSFNTYFSDSSRSIIMIKATDNIYAKYVDAKNSDNTSDTVTAAAVVQFAVASIETSAVNDSGSGNVLEITINEPDANNPDAIDNIVANVGAGADSDTLRIYLEETAIDSGSFKCMLYFTTEESHGQFLNISGQDMVNIVYVDLTIPEGGNREISKKISWDFQSTILTLDKSAYYGYNTLARVSLFNMELNDNSHKNEYVYVNVSSGNPRAITIRLKETKPDSGRFEGKLYLGRSTSAKENIIKMSGKSGLSVSYINEENSSDVAVCQADWAPQDGQITFDKPEYVGASAPVMITLKDWDLSENSDRQDKVRVTFRIKGTKNNRYVTLAETNSNSDTYKGTIYINGGGSATPSIKLEPNDILEVIYTDEDTSSGTAEERTASAVWVGF